MKTKIPAISVSSSLKFLVSLGMVFLMPLGCGQRNGSTVESYQTSAIEESEANGNSTLRFANQPESNPFEQSENPGIATISNSKTVADSCIAHSDSCIAHAETASNSFAKTTEANEPPTFEQAESPTLAASPEKNAEPDRNNNPFAVFDGETKNQNDIGYSNRTNEANSYGTHPAPGVHRGYRNFSSSNTVESNNESNYENFSNRVRASTVSSPTLKSIRNRWNDRTNSEEENVEHPEIYLNGINHRMIMDSHRIPRRIEAIPNPDRKRRRVFSPVPLKRSLEDRLLIKKMKQRHSHLYAQLKKANFSDSQIRTIASQMMADEKDNRVENADYRVEDTKNKTRNSN